MVTWISSDTNVATVARGGLVEARKAGRVLITAKWESARGSATVVVLDQVGKKPTSPPCLANESEAAPRNGSLWWTSGPSVLRPEGRTASRTTPSATSLDQ